MYKNLNYLLILFSIIIGLSIYYFYHGYIRDDWGMFQTYGTKGNIIDKFKDISTSLLANRPGLAFINVIFVNLIGDNPKIFFIFNFCVYVLGLFLFRVFLNKILNIELHLFLPILFFPIMNSTTIFSPLNLLGSNFSFLFYSIASVLLINNYKKNIFIASFSTLLFSVSLLIYEISGPLIIYNFFLILFFFKKKKNIQISGIIKLFIPMIFSLVIYFLYQKFICGFLDKMNCAVTRLHLSEILLNPTMIIKSLISYLINIFINFPIFIFSSLIYFIKKFDFISFTQIIFIIILLIKVNKKLKFPSIQLKKINYFFFFSLLIPSSIFILSGTEYPTIYGYDNRAAFPVTIILGVVIFFIFIRYKYLRKFYLLLIFLIVLNFINQAQEIRENFLTQYNIIKAAKKIDKENQNKNFLVMLPVFNTEFNFSNHEIFRYDWDFPNSIKIRSASQLQNRYYVINDLNLKDIKILDNKIVLDNYLDIPYINLELLEYDIKNEKIVKINIIEDSLKFRNIKDKLNFNYYSIINNSITLDPVELRVKIKKFFDKKLIK